MAGSASSDFSGWCSFFIQWPVNPALPVRPAIANPDTCHFCRSSVAGSLSRCELLVACESAKLGREHCGFVADRALLILQDLPTREAIEDLGTKAARVEGLENLRIGADTESSAGVRLARSDLPSLRVPTESDDPATEITHRNVWLKIVSVHFRDGYKWRFTDGGERPFTAEMEDAEFQNKVQDGQIALNANDAIRCRLREEQSLSASSLIKTIYVEEVLDHRPGIRQMSLI